MLGLVPPLASAKIYFPMRDHVLVVGKQVAARDPGLRATGASRAIRGPCAIYLVRASVPAAEVRSRPGAIRPKPARPLGRLGDVGRLRSCRSAAGRFRLVALMSVQPNGEEVRTMRMAVSPAFVVHPRGWKTAPRASGAALLVGEQRPHDHLAGAAVAPRRVVQRDCSLALRSVA